MHHLIGRDQCGCFPAATFSYCHFRLFAAYLQQAPKTLLTPRDPHRCAGSRLPDSEAGATSGGQYCRECS